MKVHIIYGQWLDGINVEWWLHSACLDEDKARAKAAELNEASEVADAELEEFKSQPRSGKENLRKLVALQAQIGDSLWKPDETAYGVMAMEIEE